MKLIAFLISFSTATNLTYISGPNSYSFKVFDLTKNWLYALDTCEKWGGSLATVISKEEQEMLML